MNALGWSLSVSMSLLAGVPSLAWSLVGFSLAIVLVFAGTRSRLRRTEPDTQSIDSEALIDSFEKPLAVLDRTNTVLVANDSFTTVFGTDLSGESIEDVVDQPELRSLVAERDEGVVSISRDGDTHSYHVHLSPVGQPQRSARQWLVSFHDVTDYREAQTQLETENERLEQFAEVISHDLRNPLDVAIGRTNAVEEALDDSELEMHLSRVQDAHTRMKQIIADRLALARARQNINETQQVPLETAAMDAWTHVETGEADLTVSTQLVVDADRECVTRVFENLFRNTIQHAGDAVSVKVGALEDDTGFFVADTGDGLDPADREAIFEAGYTSSENGTGLGLAIVSGIADAHGWNATVTDSDEGGARFEFADVDRVTDEIVARHAE